MTALNTKRINSVEWYTWDYLLSSIYCLLIHTSIKLLEDLFPSGQDIFWVDRSSKITIMAVYLPFRFSCSISCLYYNIHALDILELLKFPLGFGHVPKSIPWFSCMPNNSWYLLNLFLYWNSIQLTFFSLFFSSLICYLGWYLK